MRPARTNRAATVSIGVLALVSAAAAGAPPDRAQRNADRAQPYHSFYFSRGIYSGWSRWGRRGNSWQTDGPKSDRQFLVVLRRLTNMDAYPMEHNIALDDPALRRYPFLYILEVGYMAMTPEEMQGLRDYVEHGGFVMVDDFWGTAEWANFEEQMQQVFPEYAIVELPRDHPIFNSFYEMHEILQVPNVNNARRGITWERDGFVPHVRGIFDANGRLIMAINWNMDMGDAWEWAEQPDYPVKYSNYAFQMGVNTIIYAMSH